MLLSEAQSLRAGDVIWEVCWSPHDSRAIVLKCLFIGKHWENDRYCRNTQCCFYYVEKVEVASRDNPVAGHAVQANDIYRDRDSAKAAAVARMLRCTDET